MVNLWCVKVEQCHWNTSVAIGDVQSSTEEIGGCRKWLRITVDSANSRGGVADTRGRKRRKGDVGEHGVAD